MTLYVRFGSLFKMQELYEGNKYLQKVLNQTSATSWEIDDDADIKGIERLLVGKGINYKLK